MRNWLLGVIVTIGATGLALVGQEAQLTISAAEAKAYIGELVTVVDTLAEIRAEAQAGLVFLNLGAPYPRRLLQVAVPEAVYSSLAPEVFATSRLSIRGTPRLAHDGVAEIVCTESSQLAAAPAEGLPVVGPATPALPAPTRRCCRVCTTGTPCGNSCIARSRTCRQPPGCACNDN